ncbi:MAG: anthranilate synthase component I family protein [Planctomycetota bacterium]
MLHRRTRQLGGVLFAERQRSLQTLVVTGAPLRIVVRDGECVFTARTPEAEPLLEALLAQLPSAQRAVAVLAPPTLRVPVAQTARPSSAFDRDALREPSLFDPLRQLLASVEDRSPAPIPIACYGAFAFDLVDRFEPLGARQPNRFDDPDLELYLGLDVVRYDAKAETVDVVTRGLPWESMADVQARHAETLAHLHAPREVAGTPLAAAGERRDVGSAQEFLAGVASLRESIAAGDIFQAVLSRAVEWQCAADPLAVFERLSAREPAPYQFHLQLERGALFGASPETCVRVQQGSVEIRPIAGTTLRTGDADTDERMALAMLFDPKERAEHVMLLDLARNDVARVAQTATTEVVQQFAVEKYRRVQHLVSRVRGQLRPELDALHAYRSAANMGTLSGAPKARATELVRALESSGRGFYGGAVGVLFQNGDFDSCIAIRSLRACGGIYRAQAGAGVVWHSDPERELEETERKLRAISDLMSSLPEATSMVPTFLDGYAAEVAL